MSIKSPSQSQLQKGFSGAVQGAQTAARLSFLGMLKGSGMVVSAVRSVELSPGVRAQQVFEGTVVTTTSAISFMPAFIVGGLIGANHANPSDVKKNK